MGRADFVKGHPEGAIFDVWVVPGASRTEIVGIYGNALRVRVAAPAERGRANRAVTDHLQAELGVRVRLIGGASSRRKRFLAPRSEVAQLRSRIESLLN
jgi:uncharacterized protein (TIGR00251 family)